MQAIPYASVMGSFMYVMSCTRLNIYFTLGTVSRYQSNLSPKHWITIKNILLSILGKGEIIYLYSKMVS